VPHRCTEHMEIVPDFRKDNLRGRKVNLGEAG
jgi:hypothetical protein